MSNNKPKSEIMNIVEKQMMQNEPKFVNPTFLRLVSEGHTEQEAKEMIGAVLLEEIYFILRDKHQYDERLYEEKLNELGREIAKVEDNESGLDLYRIEDLLDLVEYNEGIFPEALLREIILRREQAIPLLLQILSDVRDNPEEYIEDPNYIAHIYAVYLLAQFRAEEAYPIMIDIMSLPDDLAYILFDDAVIGDGARLLASVCGGDTSLIKQLAEDANVDLFMRGGAIDALGILFLHGLIDRNEVLEYYRKLLHEGSIRDNPEMLAFLASACCDINAQELYEELKECFDKELVDESIIDFRDLQESLRPGTDKVQKNYADDIHHSFIDDTIAELKSWACFNRSENERKNRFISDVMIPVIKPKKIGRNEPCPCGSGKKFKKCCGK